MAGELQIGRGEMAVAALLAATVCAPLLWQIVALGMSGSVQEQAPEAALRWQADNAYALSRLAQESLNARAPDRASSYARRAIANAPFETSAYRVLAQSMAVQGDMNGGRRLIAQTGKLTRRDPRVSIWLYWDAMTARRYSAAFAQADAAMRRAPQVVPLVTHELAASIADPAAISPLAQRLSTAPPWRGAFMRELARSAPAYLLALDLLQELAETDAPPSDDEAGALVSAIAATGDLELAHAAWRGFLPADRRPSDSGGLYDGAFEYPAGPGPFGWALTASAAGGAKLELEEGSGLRVSHGGFADATVARQLLLLPPGRYRLSSKARLLDGAAMALEWRLSCERGARLLALPLSPGLAGVDEAAEFAVPEACPGQRLSLIVYGDDRRSPSMAEVGEVRLQPVGDL